ncbi:hypothetical protein MY10362_003176 [Beauveria mimosiformis]
MPYPKPHLYENGSHRQSRSAIIAAQDSTSGQIDEGLSAPTSLEDLKTFPSFRLPSGKRNIMNRIGSESTFNIARPSM